MQQQQRFSVQLGTIEARKRVALWGHKQRQMKHLDFDLLLVRNQRSKVQSNPGYSSIVPSGRRIHDPSVEWEPPARVTVCRCCATCRVRISCKS